MTRSVSEIVKALVDILAEHGDLDLHFRQHGQDAWYVNNTSLPLVVTVKTRDSLEHKEVVL